MNTALTPRGRHAALGAMMALVVAGGGGPSSAGPHRAASNPAARRPVARGPSRTWWIVPRQGIGSIDIGDYPNTVQQENLGRVRSYDPSNGDDGYSSLRLTGAASRYSLNTFCSHDEDDSFVIFQIRVESPAFRTKGGLSTALRFGLIQQRLPHLRRILRVAQVSRGQTCLVEIYDDVSRGIGFEIIHRPETPVAGARCRAILVHARGTTARLFDDGTLARIGRA